MRSFIHQYTEIHCQATGLKPDNDYDRSGKVEFMKGIRNTQITNKIIKSNCFKDYTRYSLQACFAQALELEGDFQVGDVVMPNYTQAQVLTVEGEPPPEVAVGILVMTPLQYISRGQHLRECTTQMSAGGVAKWGIERSQNTVLLPSTQAVYKALHSTVRETETESERDTETHTAPSG